MEGGGPPAPPPDTDMTTDLFDDLKKRSTLRHAWVHLKANSARSISDTTRKYIEQFDKNSERNINRMQRELRDGTFKFLPQRAVTIKKDGSAKKRAIVVAPVENRIVERALLDCMQRKVPFIQQVLNTETSIGGVPNRGVAHGIGLVYQKLQEKDAYYIRSDISGFFPAIKKDKVFEVLRREIKDLKFLTLLEQAVAVKFDNEDELGEDRKLFPDGVTGVPQGSPLSPLLGNILLHNFDKELNGKNTLCVRFIDDFILIGRRGHVEKDFKMASKLLSDLGLECHDPFGANAKKDKAQYGYCEDEFTFLGYTLNTHHIKPSDKAFRKLIEAIDKAIVNGRRDTAKCACRQNSFAARQKFAQTLVLIDSTIRGWGDAFAYSTSGFSQFDEVIDKKLKAFIRWYSNSTRTADKKTKRRALGVCLLEDAKRKTFENLPFFFEKLPQARLTTKSIQISTDGSSFPFGSRDVKEHYYGGWAAIFHDGEIELSGGKQNATNNEMELTAVVEAIRATDSESRIHIRTDSEYVYETVINGQMVRSNADLWKELRRLCEGRKVRFEWVKGHSDDIYNDKADTLAKAAAKAQRDYTRKRRKPKGR